jgi:hypothetical protein
MEVVGRPVLCPVTDFRTTRRPLAYPPAIDTDLAEVGFSLLRASLALRETSGDSLAVRSGFARAGNAFEALVQNGAPDDVARGFNRVMGAAAYHLAGYSALAFSLMSQGVEQANFAPAEEAIVLLILRDLNGLSRQARAWLLDPINSDAEIARRLEVEEVEPDQAVAAVITSTVYRAFAFFQFALQTGESPLVEGSFFRVRCRYPKAPTRSLYGGSPASRLILSMTSGPVASMKFYPRTGLRARNPTTPLDACS